VFLVPLRTAASTPGQAILTPEEIAAVFGNIENILAINKELLAEIEARLANADVGSCIADIFKKSVRRALCST